MNNIEDFKEDLKEKQTIASKNELTDFGTGYLTAMERYEKLILSGVSNQRELLIEVFDLVNIHDGDREKITKLVDITLKLINCG